MKFFIPIDPNSVKKNPRAGSTRTRVQGNDWIEWSCRAPSVEVARSLDNANNFSFTGHTGSSAFTFDVSGFYFDGADDEHAKKITAYLESNGCSDITLIFKDGSRLVNHFPEPAWFYSYAPTEVQCQECEAKFLHTDFSSDSSGDDAYSNTICPLCGEWDCCDVEFEQLSCVTKVQVHG